MIILDGKATAQKVKSELKEIIAKRKEEDPSFNLSLTVILVGENPASQVYVNNKIKACAKVGITSGLVSLPATVSEQEIIDEIEKLNNDDSVDGILLQLPLPKGFNESKIINHISPLKDVDGLTYIQQGRLYGGKKQLVPCTPMGVMRILKEYNIELEGKNVVMIGRSILVGKPLFELFLDANATVTVCHSRTKNLKEITQKADIVTIAVGRPEMLTADMVADGAVVIDIGINRTENGLKGDVAFDEVSKKASYITPVPGGVGPMTIAMLLSNTLIAHDLRTKNG